MTINELIPWLVAAAVILLPRLGINVPWLKPDPSMPTNLADLIAKIVNELLQRTFPNAQELATRQDVESIVARTIANRAPVEDAKKIRVENGNLIIPQQLVQSLSS